MDRDRGRGRLSHWWRQAPWVAGLALATGALAAIAATPARHPGPAPGALLVSGRVNTDHDDEEREEQRLLARRAVRDNCLICHTEEMLTSQRLTPAQWAAEVEKMIGWGAPLPPETRASVIAYLASEYAVEKPPAAVARTTLRQALHLIRPDAGALNREKDSEERGAPLYVTHCANCHGPDGQGAELGPNLVEKPVLLRWADYHGVVREGRGRMPGFAAALDENGEADILTWLRSRHYQPPEVK